MIRVITGRQLAWRVKAGRRFWLDQARAAEARVQTSESLPKKRVRNLKVYRSDMLLCESVIGTIRLPRLKPALKPFLIEKHQLFIISA